jgi:hypothetical protein
MATLTKWVLVLVFVVGGTLLLAQGIGIETPLAKYEAPATRDIAVGLALLLMGFGMAAFWQVQAGGGASSLDENSPKSRKIIKVERHPGEPK